MKFESLFSRWRRSVYSRFQDSAHEPHYLWLRRCSLIVASGMSLSACSLNNLVSGDAPIDVITPDQIATATGALGLYAGALGTFNKVYGARYNSAGSDVVLSGLLSDEFQDSSVSGYLLDSRRSLSSGNRTYTGLQYVRTQGLQAAMAMREFTDQIPLPLVGRMYAIVGYAELLLAERFCSGVPLPYIPAQGGAITYAPGLTTTQLFERAVAHFDTALSIVGTDSLRFRYLAQVGKARALVGIGRYADARTAVVGVPTDFVYHAEYAAPDTNTVRPQTGGTLFVSSIGEGINGINWLAAQDPRVPVKDTVKGTVRSSKYPTATSPIVIADGIEARLIEAEADLNDEKPTWLTTLNQLRARLVNSVGSRTLADTTDPGTSKARVDLLFYERAFWLYATGHRHGDLRRLVRQYRRDAVSVFPIGPYIRGGGSPVYESSVVFEIPPTNNTNPYLTGCLDTNA